MLIYQALIKKTRFDTFLHESGSSLGMQQEKHAIASNLLREHIDIAVIAKTTHFVWKNLKN